MLSATALWADYVVMDRAYEGEETRQCVRDLGTTPVVPPKSNRTAPWPYDREKYKKRNEVERLFRRLKGFRRIFSRFDKLDVVFAFFIHFALIIEGPQKCEHALASSQDFESREDYEVMHAKLEGIVVEQLTTASDALEDWRDIVPEDVEELYQRLSFDNPKRDRQ